MLQRRIILHVPQTFPDAMLAAFDAALILSQEQVHRLNRTEPALALHHLVVLGPCCRV
jgi:hypothetical protein